MNDKSDKIENRGRKPLSPEQRKNRVVLFLTPKEEQKVRALLAKLKKS